VGFFGGRLPPRPPYSAAPGPVLHSLCSIDWKVWNTEYSESVKYYKFEIVIFNFVLQDSIYTIATSNNGLSHKYRNKLRRRAAGVTVLMIRNRKSYKENFQQFLIYILPCNSYKQNITVLIITVLISITLLTCFVLEIFNNF
jgi:hypothetical protein